VQSGGALSELDSDEKPDKVHDLRESGFPIVLLSQGKRTTIGSWEDLLSYIDGRPSGASVLEWLRMCKVEESGRPLALSSLLSESVAPYFAAYREATSKHVHGYLYPGEYWQQPAVLMSALSLIEAEIAECERAAHQATRREMNKPRPSNG